MAENTDATFEHVIEGPNGQSVHFCSLEERKLAQETAQKEREEQCKKNVLLDVNHLDVTLFTEDGALPAVSDLSFIMRKGETLAVVGESGCGKSMTALSVMGLLPTPPAQITGGEIIFEGTDLTQLPRGGMRDFRGNRIGMIFQEPMTSLNPVMKSGLQIREGILVHNPNMSKQEADQKALDMIKLVGIPAPEKIFLSYPHELSGGMRQRVKQDLGTAVMLSTHDMGVVSEMADWVLVMYAGHRVEYAQSAELFTNPLHPYAQGLIASIPSFDEHTKELYAIPGSVPMLSHMPSGCPFHPRCPFAKDICKNRRPGLTAVGEDNCHTVSCWKYTDEWGE